MAQSMPLQSPAIQSKIMTPQETFHIPFSTVLQPERLRPETEKLGSMVYIYENELNTEKVKQAGHHTVWVPQQ